MIKPLESICLISCDIQKLETYLLKEAPAIYNEYKSLTYPSTSCEPAFTLIGKAFELLLSLYPLPDFYCISPEKIKSSILKHLIMHTFLSLKYSAPLEYIGTNDNSTGKPNAFSIKLFCSPFSIFINMHPSHTNEPFILSDATTLHNIDDLFSSTKSFDNYCKNLIYPRSLSPFINILYSSSTNNPLFPSTIKTNTLRNQNAARDKSISVKKNAYWNISIFSPKIFKRKVRKTLERIDFWNPEFHLMCALTSFNSYENDSETKPRFQICAQKGKKSLNFARTFIKKMSQELSEYDMTHRDEEEKAIELLYLSEYCFRFSYVHSLTVQPNIYTTTLNNENLFDLLNKISFSPDVYTQIVLRSIIFSKNYCDLSDDFIQLFEKDISSLSAWYDIAQILFFLVLSKYHSRPLILSDLPLKDCELKLPKFNTNKNIERLLKTPKFYEKIHHFYIRWGIHFSRWKLIKEHNKRTEILEQL